MQRRHCLALAFGELMDEILVSGCVVKKPDRACATGWHTPSLAIRADAAIDRIPHPPDGNASWGVRGNPHFPLNSRYERDGPAGYSPGRTMFGGRLACSGCASGVGWITILRGRLPTGILAVTLPLLR
jgi:hypothetical protein